MNASKQGELRMLPSFHDEHLIAYEVRCDKRQITFRIRPPEGDKEQQARMIEFGGVEGYHFKNDAFGNIILSIETMPLEGFIGRYGAEIEESYRTAGAPGTWAADIRSALGLLLDKGVQAYVLSSSYGLSGWLLAREITLSD